MQKGTFQVRMEPGGCLVKCSNTMVISTMAKKKTSLKTSDHLWKLPFIDWMTLSKLQELAVPQVSSFVNRRLPCLFECKIENNA